MVVGRAYVKVEWTTGATSLKEMTELVEQEGLIRPPVLLAVVSSFCPATVWYNGQSVRGV